MLLLLYISYGVLALTNLFVGVCLSSSQAQEDWTLQSLDKKIVINSDEVQLSDITDSNALSLAPTIVEEELPDIKEEITYLGCNNRPDADSKKYIIKLKKSEETRYISLGEKVFLNVSLKDGDISYTFSDDPTNLWIEGSRILNEAYLELRVFVQNPDGKIIETPSNHHILNLKTQYNKFLEAWEIGGIKVDASFAVHQKMRRVGQDVFLMLHGGDTYMGYITKERLDFCTDKGELYSRYVTENDILLWDGEYWQNIGGTSLESTQVPIIEVKKLEDKIANLEIWNIAGSLKQTVNLVKSLGSPLELTEAIKEIEFVGMHSWSKPIVVLGKNRMIIQSNDWLLKTMDGWQKLNTVESIQDYVLGKLQGVLFVFDSLEKNTNGFVLQGHLFNTFRTVVENVQISMKQLPEIVEDANKEVKSKGAGQ